MDKGGVEMEKNAQSNFNIMAVGGAVCAMLCLIFAPAEAIESARYGLSLCAELIVPSLLPFFAASSLLIRLRVPVSLGHLLAPAARRLWGVSGAGASAFLSGICGGYPLGAQTVAEMYGEGLLSKDESERLLGFCNNSGPSFLIGVIGTGAIGSRVAAIAQAFGCNVIAYSRTKKDLPGVSKRNAPLSPLRPVEAPPFSSALVDSVRQAVSAVLSVCGFVICFCVFSGLLDALGVFRAAASLIAGISSSEEAAVRVFLVGMLELGSGIGQMRALSPSLPLFALAAFLAGWGGLSVQFQTAAVLGETELSLRRHRIGRLLSGILSALLALLLGRLFLWN